jgi:glycosyltransferase involved in cell wall biosynthesis
MDKGPLLHRPHTILYFSSFAFLGWGGQESLWHLVSRLDRREFRPIVVLPHAGSFSERLLEHRVDVRFIHFPRISPSNFLKIIEAERRLLSLIDQERVDILHTDGPRNTIYAGIAGRLKGKQVIWHVRSSTADRYDRLLSLLCSKIILVANCLTFRFQFPGQTRKLITIHNGVDVNHFAPCSERRVGIPGFRFRPDDVIITVTARVEKQKGQRYLIEACAQLRHLLPRLHILCAGKIVEPEYHQACIQRASELGVIDNVHFLGHVENVRRLLQGTDIFVLPSIEGEAFPRSVLEAMSSGIPVVATDCGGTREAVEDEVCGFMVQPQDSTAMARRIAILSKDWELRSRMGRAGRKIAVERFGIERNVARTVEVYREILPAKGLASAFAIQPDEAHKIV